MPVTTGVARELSDVVGPVHSADAADRGAYDEERTGFDLNVQHRPDVVVGAADEQDVAAAVRAGAAAGAPVVLQATGHGPARGMDGGILVSTRRLSGVRVDPATATARVQAGATSGDVLAATAEHGLAARVGAAPGVGFVAFTLGGGLGALGRAHGWSADAVRRLDVVTAGGERVTVSADNHPDLFWGLRGGGGGLAAVVAVEVELVALRTIYGGGMFFDVARVSEVAGVLADAMASAPEDLTLSVAVVQFPDVPAVPAPLRGRSCCHVRVVHLGATETGEQAIAPLRRLGPFLDTVTRMPFTGIGSVHADPVGPMPVRSDSLALTADPADVLPSLLGTGGASLPFMLELRHLGGALSRPADNAVGHRRALVNVFTSAYPGVDPDAVAAAETALYEAVARHSAGGPLRNYLPAGRLDASHCHEPATAARLAALGREWDPDGVFSGVARPA